MASSISSSSSSSSSSESEVSRKPHSPSKKRKHEETLESDSEAESEGSASSDHTAKSLKQSNAKLENEIETEVKVLSHKEQRRLKKRLAKEGASATEKVEDDLKKKKRGKTGNKSKETNDDDSKTKRQNSIWVGNLSYKTTSDALRSFFKEAGEVTRVHMPTQASGGGANQGQKNKGFAYVDFSSPDAKNIAIAFSEKNLDGRRLLIKDGGDFNGRPKTKTEDVDGVKPGQSKVAQKILATQKQPPIPCLFIGNLGFEATEQSIRGMIEGHTKALAERSILKSKKRDEEAGVALSTPDESKEEQPVSAGIKKVRMGTFEDSGLCKGFAFIDFDSTTHATAVLINPRNHFLDGRKLVVEYASADAARRGGYREKSQNSYAKGTAKGTGSRKIMDSPKEISGTKEAQEGLAKVDNESQLKKMRRTEEQTSRARPNKRPKPGAALALAKRESYAIVPSEGSRITFT